MISKSRRSFIRLAAGTVGATVATSMLPSSIQAALAIPAHRRHGNLKDVEHVVILMQENRSFDHYFGTLKGVRGFGDRMAIPLPDGQRVWHQKGSKGEILPYHFDTSTTSAQRVDGTPHTWPDAQQAWNEGRMDKWLPAKTERSLGYYKEQDIAFQFAMANAFTICDAYHCSFQGGTNPNRLFLWTGTNDPLGQHGGPVTTNDHDSNGPVEQGYTWTTYPERLQAAGITWRVYQDMADNFSDNPLIGFRQYRAAAPDSPLIVNGLSTWKLDALKRDVLANSLPQVSWIVAPAKYSEHPGPSSPIWGAEYTSWVLDALTANPEVWSKTALLVMFDENDGFFDHVAPPAAPSLNKDGTLRGKTTADATLEWHTKGDIRYRNQPYGLGPRVPMYVISPWSKGGWVNSQVFDHTSVIRFLEQRFGVMEPNISPWRRAVCGDLTSAFNFANPNNEPFPELPDTSQADAIVASQIKLPKPKPPAVAAMPKQEMGIRPARALPYELGVHARYHSGGDALSLTFANTGKAGAVFQVFDLLDSENPPKRYTVGARKRLHDSFQGDASGDYHLEVHGPNGFLRVFRGNLRRDLAERKAPLPEVRIDYEPLFGNLRVQLINRGRHPVKLTVKDNVYRQGERRTVNVPPGQRREVRYSLRSSGNWYDFSVSAQGADSFLRRFSGRMEDGRSGFSDPGMGLGTLTF
ncbi:phospholipase C, phosphocholine-specific [Pseudomonas aeruginosa]|nr:phospholipase C, phosphocholine-specific [Pseudomonas aeruginosa]